MKFLSGIFGQKKKGAAADNSSANAPADQNAPVDMFEMAASDAEGTATSNATETADTSENGPVNIWDMDNTGPSTPKAEAAPAVAAPDRASARARRNRTRLIGFDKSDGDVVDLFDEDKKVSPTERVQFPVGWMLVIDGPGRGHCFALTAGMAQIGRAEDQAIQLDFGDVAISRNNHAAIVFDPDEKKFLLGHGGKANIVRLNGKPVISNEDLVDGDTVSIGDTTLQLKTLISDDFSWDVTNAEEDDDDDMAIA